VTEALPAAAAARLREAGQGHLVDAVAAAPAGRRAALAQEVLALDLDLVADLVRRFVRGGEEVTAHPHGEIGPPEAVPLGDDEESRHRDERAAARGREALEAGEIALVLLAGGQGSRLGFEGPKGLFPFGPVTGRTLFAHHAARVAALRARYGAALPLYVLTSPVNDEVTRAAFAEAGHWGLAPESVRFVVQGTLPAVDRVTGGILLDAPDRLALSPDGHGGLLMALRRAGALDEMEREGIRTFFTFQVDNPLVRVANPVFVGHHRDAGADMSNLAVRKHDPGERVGVIARIGDHTGVVEYSDLPDELAGWRDDAGDLVLWAGSIATHLIEVAFARELTEGGLRLPYHRAIKKVPFVAPGGARVEPEEPNAVKFETFIFDALPFARRSVTMEVPRAVDFSPIKNATGADSPETCRRDCNRLWAGWLEAAGATVARGPDGEPPDIEIDPRLALDGEELAARLPPGRVVDGPTALGPEDAAA